MLRSATTTPDEIDRLMAWAQATLDREAFIATYGESDDEGDDEDDES